MVRFVLSAIPVYLLIAMNIPKWVIKLLTRFEEDLFGKEGGKWW
jgi:hypothetical protein